MFHGATDTVQLTRTTTDQHYTEDVTEDEVWTEEVDKVKAVDHIRLALMVGGNKPAQWSTLQAWPVVNITSLASDQHYKLSQWSTLQAWPVINITS